jgi:hypothetical protein
MTNPVRVPVAGDDQILMAFICDARVILNALSQWR